MIEIKFKKSELITSIVLCVAAIIFITVYVVYDTKAHLQKILVIPFLIGVLLLLRTRLINLFKCNDTLNNAALIVDQFGITNHTLSKSVSIAWSEISAFKVGFFRTRQIYIQPKHPEKYPRKKYFGLYFTSKPSMLWIDSVILDMKREEVLRILNSYLYDQSKKIDRQT